MRLSPRRLLLRVVLLVIGGGFMLWRAGASFLDARHARDAGLLGARLALVWGLVGVLALATAASTAWSLVRRPRRRTLRLDDVAQPGLRVTPRPGPSEPRDQ